MDKHTIKYILDYYSRFKTKDEHQASTHFSSSYKLESYTKDESTEKKKMLRERYLEKGWISTDPKVLALLKDGIDIFRERVAHRILSEHREELFFNNCPKCGTLARTPKAKQCRSCYHRWE